MLNFLPDVYINTDQCKGASAGKSPGFGISLTAETNSGTFYCSELVIFLLYPYRRNHISK